MYPFHGLDQWAEVRTSVALMGINESDDAFFVYKKKSPLDRSARR